MKLEKDVEERLKKSAKCFICNGSGINVFADPERACGYCYEGVMNEIPYDKVSELLAQEIQTAVQKDRNRIEKEATAHKNAILAGYKDAGSPKKLKEIVSSFVKVLDNLTKDTK